MPKQLHLTKDFFVNAPENEARQHILELPNCINNIKFVEQNRVRHSIRFMYESPADPAEENNLIDISLLPLSVNQTRITLHGSYINGNAFHKDLKLKNALSNVESAIHAVVKGSINEYVPQQIKISHSRSLNIILVAAGLLGVVYLIKSWF